MRIGDDRVIPVSVRLIVASNQSLKETVAGERLRLGLFYILSVLEITIPALRQRPMDIGPLFLHYLAYFGKLHGRGAPGDVSPVFRRILTGYSWPGNIREPENTAEKYVILRQIEDAAHVEAHLGGLLRHADAGARGAAQGTLAEMELRYIEGIVKEENGSMSRAAARLGKENPRRNYKAAFGPILATRQRQLPTNNCNAVTNPRISVWSIVAIIFLYPSLCQEVGI
jgi:transcriptional regulator with PAS, ATPase and Fis domain